MMASCVQAYQNLRFKEIPMTFWHAANIELSGGQLNTEARADLRRVAEDLTALLPTMQRLHLRLPDLEALERARMVEAA
jgi:hypothetical protein